MDVGHYHLELVLQPPSRRLLGKARLRIQAPFPEDGLRLDLHPDLQVESVRWQNRNHDFSQARRKLWIPLPDSPEPESTGDLEIRYRGTMAEDESQGEPVGLLADRRSLVSYLQPDGAHHFFPCNDHPSDKATYQIDLFLPYDGFGAATGAFGGLSFLPGSMRWRWQTEKPLATYLLAVAAGPFQAIARPGKVPILDLAWSEDADRIRRHYQVAADMIPFLESRFGPYPFERYGHVFLNRPIGGLENQTMTVIGRGAGFGQPEGLMMHELAHQWFGDWVSPKQWRDLWLSEGWATYCEVLWMQERQGDQAAAQLLREWRNSALYLGRRHHPWTLANPDPDYLFDFHLVYNKGALVLHMLAQFMGSDRFHAAARHFLQRNAGGNADTASFQSALEQGSGEDLESFFQAWVHANRLPLLKGEVRQVRRRQGWRTVVRVQQLQAGPAMPLSLPWVLSGPKGSHSGRTRMNGRQSEWTVDLEFQAKTLQLDPNRELPALFSGKGNGRFQAR